MPPKILVVDDNEMNRDMLSRRLRRLEYDVDMAVDGETALKLVNEQSYQLILLDIMMPGVSGYDVLQEIKSNPTHQHLPVIMISAVDDLESVVRCIEMGAEDYLFKPFNPVLLKARIEATLTKYLHQVPSKLLDERLALVKQVTSIQTIIEAMQTSGEIADDHVLVQQVNELVQFIQTSHYRTT